MNLDKNYMYVMLLFTCYIFCYNMQFMNGDTWDIMMGHVI